ncbi:MAG: hypothetical protein EA344_05780 [Alkalicoccus sp.]|nr:MAG: hypothetical protein EA344_05780 [Alkalicoccus sp.]
MTTSTDIVAYKLMADVYKKVPAEQLLKKTALFLYEYVPQVEWCGIYTLEENCFLASSSYDTSSCSSEHENVKTFHIGRINNGRLSVCLYIRYSSAFSGQDEQKLRSLASALGRTCD